MPSRIFAPALLDGQVAVVTGGGTGLGRATALELAACGARVIVAGRRPDPLEEAAAACEGGRGEAIACDVREEDQIDALVDRVLDRHGRIDLLVNNAGGQFMSPAEAITPKGFRTVVRLNLEGTWLMTHAVATRAMILQGGGKVVSVTLSPHHGLPGMAHSSAARAGVENLMRVLSIEWARFGPLRHRGDPEVPRARKGERRAHDSPGAARAAGGAGVADRLHRLARRRLPVRD